MKTIKVGIIGAGWIAHKMAITTLLQKQVL